MQQGSREALAWESRDNKWQTMDYDLNMEVLTRCTLKNSVEDKFLLDGFVKEAQKKGRY